MAARKRTEDEVKQKNPGVSGQLTLRDLLFRALIETSVDAFVAIDENQHIVDWNHQAELMFGWTTNEAMGRAFDELIIAGATRNLHRDGVKAFIAHQGKGRHIGKLRRLQALHRDGHEFPVEMQTAATQVDGRWLFSSVIRDISQRVIAEERLAQAEKMESIGQLTGGLAHDFNNILGIITGSLEILGERLKLPANQEMIQIALQAAERGAEVTRSLQAVARRRPVRQKDADVNVLIREMEPLLRRTLTPAISLVMGAEADMARVMLDISNFNNVLLNLVINARDAMPNGGSLMVYTQTLVVGDSDVLETVDLEPGPYIVLGVDDNGSGMSPEVLSRAVEPFFTTKERSKGTGMGLAMAYAFARQSAGALRLRSTPGKGTSIHLFLPVLPPSGLLPGEVPEAEQKLAGGSEWILLVDDERSLLTIGHEWLAAMGYRVEIAGGVEEARALLGKRSFDLLITDVLMPGSMDGFGLAEQALCAYPGLQVMFVTGHADREIPYDLQKWPMLSKPIRRAELIAAARTLLEQRD